MANTPRLAPQNQFPDDALKGSVQVQPPPTGAPFAGSFLTIAIASSADLITPWGINTILRDQQLRKFWPTESYLAGALVNCSFRNATADWAIQASSSAIEQAVTDMLMTAVAGDQVGWVPFIQKLSQDLYAQDNGGFIELIRVDSVDAASKFKGALAPVIGIAHLDAGQCIRTGNADYPVIYTDREGKTHKLAWYEVIPLSDFPSPIERMNGVGVCAVSRTLRLAQIMRSIAIFKDEEVSGRNIRKINLVGGVAQSQLDDAVRRTIERADNAGQMRFIEHAILASLDPEKPVSSTTIDMASLPEGFNYDTEMQWFISGLALDFATDYQEFAPLPGGNIGSASQSVMLNRKSSGKGPRTFMDTISYSFKNYGVLPRGAKMIFDDKNQQEEMERQEIRTKAVEEAAMAVNTGILSPEAAAKSLVQRGIYKESDIIGLEEFWNKMADAKTAQPPKQPIGSVGGNTIGQDAQRVDTGKTSQTIGGRLKKALGWDSQSE